MQIQPKEQQNYKYDQIVEHLQENDRFWQDINLKRSFIDFSAINQRLIRLYQNQQKNLFFYFGKYHPDKQKLKSLAIYMQQKIDISSLQKYSVIFFNQDATQNAYSQFKNIFMCLPQVYLKKLSQIVLVSPKFYQKKISRSLIYGRSNTFYQQKFYTVKDCYQLCETLKIQQKQLIKYLPHSIQQLQYPDLRMKKGIQITRHRMNLLGQDQKANLAEDKSWIDILVSSFIENKVSSIQDYPLNQNGIPILLDVLIMYFRIDALKLTTQGLFRKSISIDDEQDTLNALKNYNFDYFSETIDPHIVAVAIKRIFSTLQVPVVPFKLYEDLLNVQLDEETEQSGINELRIIVEQLSDTSFQSLQFLFQFLTKDVLKFSLQNQMSSNSLAICLGPCLMKSQMISLENELINMTKTKKIIQFMIIHYKEIFSKQKTKQIAYKSTIMHKRSFIQQVFDVKPK